MPFFSNVHIRSFLACVFTALTAAASYAEVPKNPVSEVTVEPTTVNHPGPVVLTFLLGEWAPTDDRSNMREIWTGDEHGVVRIRKYLNENPARIETTRFDGRKFGTAVTIVDSSNSASSQKTGLLKEYGRKTATFRYFDGREEIYNLADTDTIHLKVVSPSSQIVNTTYKRDAK